MADIDRLRKALEKIAEAARSAIDGDDGDDDGGGDEEPGDEGAEVVTKGKAVCTPKMLPRRQLIKAAQEAVKINPVNAPLLAQAGALGADVSDPLQIAVLTSKYWGPTPRKLTVSFLESTPADLRRRILSHMNAWTRTGCIEFVETRSAGQVRISRQRSGYWSYLGTDILQIQPGQPTMNLQGFTKNTPEREYKRVVRHETGHTLGFPHEHMRQALVARVDPEKAYEYFERTQGWDRAMVDAQVLTPLDERSLMQTPADQTSIMCYQLPGSITRDGKPITGGTDINQTDYAFVGRIYPKRGRAPAAGLDEDAPEGDEDSDEEDS